MADRQAEIQALQAIVTGLSSQSFGHRIQGLVFGSKGLAALADKYADNRIAITPLGEIVLEHAHSIEHELAALQEHVEREKRRLESLVRVGHFSTPLSQFKMPHLAQELPDMTFEVHVANARALCEGLSDGMYDLINDAYDSYDVFPYLIFPGQIKNLTFA